MDVLEKLSQIVRGFSHERITQAQARSIIPTLEEAIQEIQHLRGAAWAFSRGALGQHTAGDWEVCTVDGGESADEIVTQIGGCLVNIAVVRGPCEYSEARPAGEPEPTYMVSSEEARANARLLAAAPRLRVALINLLRQTQHYPLAPVSQGPHIAAARAALAFADARA